jgi:peptidyl-prolyl cis-trans isomerase D
MLQNIRNNIQGMVAKVIIALIIVPFAIFGVESLMGGSASNDAAKVNGEKVSETELQQAVNVQRRQLMAMMGDNIQPNMLEESALRGPALDGLIAQYLLRQGASDLKLGVSPQAVDQTILSMPAFQDNGKFSTDRYQVLLRNQGYTPAHFKQLLHQELVVNQLHSGIADSDFVTPKELQRVAGLLQQQRSFSYVTIPVANLQGNVVVSDSDIQAYYDEHKGDFLSDERIKPEYIELRVEDFFKPVDDAAVQAEYDREIANFKPVTGRHAAHILIEVNAQRTDQQAKELVESVQAQLAAGADFAKLAGQYSDDLGSKNAGGDLGNSDGDAFPAFFEQALGQLQVGAVSAPVKSESGYHLIKLLDAQVKEKPSFEQRKVEIAQRLQRANAQPELIKNAEKLRDLVFNSEGLTAPAKELNLPLKEGDWIERKTTDPLFANPKVMAAAFSAEVLKDGNNSEVVEVASDHFVVLRAKQHELAAPKPLDDVRSAIVATLKQERAVLAAKDIAAELVHGSQQGGSLEQLASQRGYSAKVVEKAARGNAAAAPELVRAAFGMARPAKGQPLPVETVSLSNGDVALIQLQDVAEGETDSLNPTQRNALVSQLEQGFGTAGFAALMENLRARAEIKRR